MTVVLPDGRPRTTYVVACLNAGDMFPEVIPTPVLFPFVLFERKKSQVKEDSDHKVDPCRAHQSSDFIAFAGVLKAPENPSKITTLHVNQLSWTHPWRKTTTLLELAFWRSTRGA